MLAGRDQRQTPLNLRRTPLADAQPTPYVETPPLVQVSELKKHFPVTRGLILERRVGSIKAVDGVSFDIWRGETLGLVG